MTCSHGRAPGEPFAHGQLPEAREDFAGLVAKWRRGARGEGLAEGLVPGNVYWLARGRRIVGTVRLRHRLNENLLHEGGHIGYEVRPTERAKGYASLMLRLALAKARQRGLETVLLPTAVYWASAAVGLRAGIAVLRRERSWSWVIYVFIYPMLFWLVGLIAAAKGYSVFYR